MTDRVELANAIRVLAMDAVQEANSGHPGMPMGMAEIAETLWNRHLRHNPGNPAWPGATVSCCRTATDPCCSTRCST
jgi:transketolase